MKEIIVLDGKLYVREKANNIIAKDGCLYAQDFSTDPEDWITINGAHVEPGEGGKIVGGAGGKLNGSVYKGTQKVNHTQSKSDGTKTETPLQRMKRWNGMHVDGMKKVANSGGKYTAVETTYPNGEKRIQYYESGRWTNYKPKGLAESHGKWVYKPLKIEIKE